MTDAQFNVLTKLMRGKPDTDNNMAARLVLVVGMTLAEASRTTGVQRSNVHTTQKRYKAADALVREAYGLEPVDWVDDDWIE